MSRLAPLLEKPAIRVPARRLARYQTAVDTPRLLLAAPERRSAVAFALHQIFPHRLGVLLEHERSVRRADVPEAFFDLGGELARLPADEAHEVARVVRRALDDAVDVLRIRGDKQIAEQAHRRRA